MKDAKICRNILLIFMKPSETMINEMEKIPQKKPRSSGAFRKNAETILCKMLSLFQRHPKD